MFDEQISKDTLARKRKRRLVGTMGLLAIALLSVMIFLINHSAQRQSTRSNEPHLAAETVLTQAQLEQARAQFQSLLVEYAAQIEPLLLQPSLQDFDSAGVAKIEANKTAALVSFGAGEYHDAQLQLQSVMDAAKALIKRWDQAFDAAFTKAKQSFNQGAVDSAELNLLAALKLKPLSAEALALQTRLAVLPQVQSLLSQAKVAKMEQKLSRESELLQKVLGLDAERQPLMARINEISQILKHQQFIVIVNRGFQAVSVGDIATAQNALIQAKAIDPFRAELTLLSGEINQVKATTQLNQVLTEIERLSVEDDWVNVVNRTKQWSTQFPNNAQLMSANKQAMALLVLEQQLEIHLSQPMRLADATVNKHVQKWLKANAQLSTASPRISQKVQQLQGRLNSYGQPVAVSLFSDGKTHITVVGKGHVGKIKQYQIQLTPGHYVIQGSREGYRVVRIDVEVSPAIVNQSVEVICRERI